MAKALTFLGLILFVIVLVIVIVPHYRSDRPHGVTLTWQPPPPESGGEIVGYNVYRKTDETPKFVKIAERVRSPYEDTLVMSGRTYFYAVTSVDQSGRESRYSAVTRATVP